MTEFACLTVYSPSVRLRTPGEISARCVPGCLFVCCGDAGEFVDTTLQRLLIDDTPWRPDRVATP